jgi:hypothetical protein
VVRGVEKDDPDANTPLEGLSIMLPIALTDDQLDTVMRGAQPLSWQDRHRYLQRVAELLYQQRETPWNLLSCARSF